MSRLRRPILLPMNSWTMASAVNLLRRHPICRCIGCSVRRRHRAWRRHGFGLWMGAVSAWPKRRSACSRRSMTSSPARSDLRDETRSPATKAKSATRMPDRRCALDRTEDCGAVDAADSAVAGKRSPLPATAQRGLMPEDFRQPKSMVEAAEGRRSEGDFRHRSEAGKGAERPRHLDLCADRGLDQPEEIAWVDDYLSFKGRICRDDWIGQASEVVWTRRRSAELIAGAGIIGSDEMSGEIAA